MIVLDTHAWIWWVADDRRLSSRARRAIDTAPAVGIPAICAWEVAMLVARQRLELDRDVLVWIRQALSGQNVELLPLTPEIAVAASRLPSTFHGDPADRLIVATAAASRAALVSKDQRIAAYDGVSVIW